MRASGLAAAAVLAVSIAAAAAGQTPPHAAQLFISPSGQPFHAPVGSPYPSALWFAQVDKRGDGKIDRAEVLADAEAFFHALDKNHDGVIDAFELQAYEQDVVPEILGAYRIPAGTPRPFPRGAGGPERRRGLFGGGDRSQPNPGEDSVLDGAAPYEFFPIQEPVASADLAMDGRITLAEFRKTVADRFDRLDAKHVGYLTLATLPKTVAQQDAARMARNGGRAEGR